MLDKLEAINKKYLEIREKINSPDVINDMKKLRQTK